MNENSTKLDFDDYELDEEYDLALLPVMAKGRYAPGQPLGKNLVMLAPDVAQAFPDDDAVNQALCLIIQVAKLPRLQEVVEKA